MEIKEILEILRRCTYGDEVYLIKEHGATVLLDYITNLQEEKEKWFAVAKDFEMEAHDLWNKNNELEEAQKNFEKQFIKEMDYKSRIEKAVEELELWQPKIEIIKLEKEYLLNILNGRSDE